MQHAPIQCECTVERYGDVVMMSSCTVSSEPVLSLGTRLHVCTLCEAMHVLYMCTQGRRKRGGWGGSGRPTFRAN